MARLLLVLIFILFTPIRVYANYTSKLEQQINIIDQTYTTSNTSASPTDNRLGLVYWDQDVYNQETVYFEAVIKCDACSGGNAQVTVGLYNDAGSLVTDSAISTTNSTYTLVRSDAITDNLADNDEYSPRLLVDATTGTASIIAARLIIVQSGTNITNSETQIEIGNNISVATASYQLMTGPKIYRYDTANLTDVQNIYFDATLKGSTETTVAYASLSSSSDCSTTVSGSEITVTGITWDRVRSGDLKSNLTNDTNYWVCVKATDPDLVSLASAKIVIDQASNAGIYKLQLIHTLVNTPASDTDDSYSNQNVPILFDPANYDSDILHAYYQNTLRTTAGDAYSRLFNLDASTAMTGSELTTVNSGYTYLISNDLRTYLPTSSQKLDTQLRNSGVDTTTASQTSLIINLERILDAALTFSLSTVNANTVNNGITTSVASELDELPFSHLTFNTPKYVAQALYASTNAPSGYLVTFRLLNYLQGLYPANNIDPFTADWYSPASWDTPDGTTPNDNTGWLGANTTDTRVAGWDSGNQKFGAVTNSNQIAMFSPGADSGTTAYVTYALEVNILQPADQYSGTLLYHILPLY